MKPFVPNELIKYAPSYSRKCWPGGAKMGRQKVSVRDGDREEKRDLVFALSDRKTHNIRSY